MSAISGFADIAEELNEFGEGLEDCADDGMEEVADETAADTAEEVADTAKWFAPVDTGTLRSRIFVWPYPEQTGVRRIIAATDYAKHVEYGTTDHWIPPSPRTTYDEPVYHPGARPHPYMRPSLLLHRRTMHRIFSDEIDSLFRRKLR